ncbi:MAG: VanZ family protein [Paludibacteraceae bacterium]|nr:VanZ family protein [Paludibacteraceae bacterium]MCR5570063.1 VanZ family protein [Paludibacteraceae bacterium]
MMDNILRFFRHYGLSICVALTILYLCMMPGNDSNFDIKIPNMDKYVHAVMYFVLSFTISLNLYQEYTKYKSMTMVMWAVVIPILFGGLIEVMQDKFTVSRTGDALDLLADAIGAILGYLFASWFVPRHFKQNEN